MNKGNGFVIGKETQAPSETHGTLKIRGPEWSERAENRGVAIFHICSLDYIRGYHFFFFFNSLTESKRWGSNQ